MADVFSRTKRSDIMSRIRGRENKATELALATLLRRGAVKGWRRHLPVEGTPDFAFPQDHVAIFVDGCFWHRCPKHSTLPTTNRAFWRHKLDANRTRDQKVNRQLRKHGWRVLRIWEHELRAGPDKVIDKIKAELRRMETDPTWAQQDNHNDRR